MGIKSISIATIALTLSTSASASLIFTIDNYTADELSFTISGTFDESTFGNAPGYLAIKNDWSNNVGIHTELFSATPTVTFNTITIRGLTPITYVRNNDTTFADSIFFGNSLGSSNAYGGGTSVTGSMTLSAIGGFNPLDAATLELVSGFVDNDVDWARLEASAQLNAVPVPAAVWLFGSGLIGLIGMARRKKS